MTFDQQLETGGYPDMRSIEHDPKGDIIQMHDTTDGGSVWTFDPTWCAKMGWLIGDTLTIDIDGQTGALNITNAAADLRKSSK
jgi:hypothetical protein